MSDAPSVSTPSVSAISSSSVASLRRKVATAQKSLSNYFNKQIAAKSKYDGLVLESKRLNQAADNALQEALKARQLDVPYTNQIVYLNKIIGSSGYVPTKVIDVLSFEQINQWWNSMKPDIDFLHEDSYNKYKIAKSAVRKAVSGAKAVLRSYKTYLAAETRTAIRQEKLDIATANYNAKIGVMLPESYINQPGTVTPPIEPELPTTEPTPVKTDAMIAADTVSTTNLQHYATMSTVDKNRAFQQATSTLSGRAYKKEISWTTYTEAYEILNRRIKLNVSVY